MLPEMPSQPILVSVADSHCDLVQIQRYTGQKLILLKEAISHQEDKRWGTGEP